MAIALSVGLSLIVGITVMFQTKYFWGKESNPNINNLNCTMTNLTSSFGTVNTLVVIVVVVLALGGATFACTCRAGF